MIFQKILSFILTLIASEANLNLREFCFKTEVDILCIDETKIDPSYADSQFHVDGYQFPPFRKDRNKHGVGKIVYERNGIMAKKTKGFGGTISLQFTQSKKKWCVLFVYRSPQNINKASFFNEISITLNQITNKYENFIIMEDLNIDTVDKTKGTCNYLSDLCDTFSLTNIINGKTCFKAQKGTSIDFFLTNRPRSFHKTGIFETGFSDHHKLILSVFRSYFIRIPPKTTEYRNYKNFNETVFLHDLDQELLKGEMYKSNNEMYSTFTKVFRIVLDKHAPLKVKKVRGNQGPFMTKELSKAIMNKSKIRNKYQKWPSRENFLALKETKKFCNKLTKSVKKSYLCKVTGKGFVTNKAFCNAVKSFLTNKGFLTNETITIENKGQIVTDKSKLVNLFNSHFINIVEKTSGCPPEIESNPENKTSNDLATVPSTIRGSPIKQAVFLPGQATPYDQLLIQPLLLVPECYFA